MKRLYLILFSCTLWLPNAVQSQEVLNSYIDSALTNNLVLRQKHISLEKSLLALRSARAMFFPAIAFDAQYLRADGGRTIDIPVGTMLNPVYQTLNALTGSNSFPKVDNVSEQLNPDNFLDARIKTTMPLIRPELKINRNIRSGEGRMKEFEVDVYRRELVNSVKAAYYEYLMADEAIRILESSTQLLKRNLRLNQSLLANGKGLPAYVSRAESEVAAVEMELQNAVNNKKNAAAYFNALLNRSFDAPIVVSQVPDERLAFPDSVDISGREELRLISISKDINEEVIKLNRSFRLPRVNAFLDVGTQAFDFRINSKSMFYLGGVQVNVPIFAGRSNIFKIEQALLNKKELAAIEEDALRQLELAASVSRNEMRNSINIFSAAQRREEAAEKYFHLINRGYQEGVNTYIEYLDARNQWTTAQLQLNIHKYRFLTARANYERETATYTIK